MAAPTRGNLAGLKRLGRFLIARPRLVQTMGYQGDFVAPRSYPGGPREVLERPGWLYAPVDSNWADCRLTRKSTSGGALLHGSHVLCTWSVTQAVQALSSGEAEFYAVLKGVVEGLGLSAVAKELDFDLRQLKDLGLDARQLRDAGFDARESALLLSCARGRVVLTSRRAQTREDFPKNP